MNTFKKVKVYRSIFKNYFVVLLSIICNKNSVEVITRDNYKATLPISSVYNIVSLYSSLNNKPNSSDIVKFISKYNDVKFSVLSYLAEQKDTLIFDKVTEENLKNDIVRFVYKQIPVTLHGIKANGDIKGIFLEEEYKFLDPIGRSVLDIGANIGDSAVFFAISGAKRVVALEPFPYPYKFAVKNIRSNSLEDRVEVLNAGYGTSGYVKVGEDAKTGVTDYLSDSNQGIMIKSFSLENLVSQFEFSDSILKMDCEGCEYNLLREDKSVIRKFLRIQIEFHYGYKRLENKLFDSGFKVWHSEPEKSGGNIAELKKLAMQDNDMTYGYIYAERN